MVINIFDKSKSWKIEISGIIREMGKWSNLHLINLYASHQGIKLKVCFKKAIPNQVVSSYSFSYRWTKKPFMIHGIVSTPSAKKATKILRHKWLDTSLQSWIHHLPISFLIASCHLLACSPMAFLEFGII